MKLKKKLYQIKTIVQTDRKDLVYETNKYVFDFQQFEKVRSFIDSIFNGKISQCEADNKQSNLLKTILKFSIKAILKAKIDKKRKRDTYESMLALYVERESVLNFKKGIFPLKLSQRKGSKS